MNRKISIIVYTLVFILMGQAWSQTGKSFMSLTDDGAWIWYTDPRAVYHKGQNDKTYVGWVTKKYDIQVASYDHNLGTVEVSTVKLNTDFSLPLNNMLDDHINPSLLVRPDGKIMVFYSAHFGREMYYRITVRSEDISEWGEEKILGTNIGWWYGETYKDSQSDCYSSQWCGYTYTNPMQLKSENDKIFLFWRGGDSKPNISESSDGGLTWTKAKSMVTGENTGRPYVKYRSNGKDKIHIVFTDGHPTDNRTSPNNVYYAYYKNGAFYNVDGSKIKDKTDLPFRPSEVDKVHDAEKKGVDGWTWDIAADKSDNPVIVYVTLPDSLHHNYRYAKWTGSEWVDNEIIQSGKYYPLYWGDDAGQSNFNYSGGVLKR